MPLLGKKSFKPSPLPKDLKSEEEVFVIKQTNEVFRSYDEYVNRIILYGFQVWSCQLTGKTNLKYAEAVACEKQALKRLESFPKYFEKPLLQIVHHSSSGLQTLVLQLHKHLEKEYFENEPVKCCVNGHWYPGRVSKVHHRGLDSTDSENKDDLQYDIACESIPDGIKGILPGNIKRQDKVPSVEMLKCFIRANTENPWSSDSNPWVVKADLVKKYSLTDKLDDFSLIFNKKPTAKSKTPTKRSKSCEKPKNKMQDSSTGHAKPKVNKLDPSQRKLDSFRKNTGDISKSTGKNMSSLLEASSMKLTQNSDEKYEPVEKDFDEKTSRLGKDDMKTPSGVLRGTPIKCRLLLTPVKSPNKGSGKSPAPKTPIVKEGANMNTSKPVVIVDDTNDVIVTGCKSPKSNLSHSLKKLNKSPKSGKSRKMSEGREDKLKDKLLKDVVASKSVKSVIAIDDNNDEKDFCTKKTESKKNIKVPKAVAVQKPDIVNLTDDSEDDFVSVAKKITVTPAKVKQSADKMKQTTLLDLTKKPEHEKTVLSSPKVKTKKQKTLSEMFSAALQKDKPNTLNALIRKTAQELSSPSSFALNLPTPQQDHVTEKWNAHKEKLKWQLNGKLGVKKKQDDSELLNLTPLPPSKPVNLFDGITPESYSDVAMIAQFVDTFQDLLFPKETLHISIDTLSMALVNGVKGFALLSRILVIFLQILLQDSSTKGEELGMQLSAMPLTQQTASEVSRLYLNAKFKMLTAYKEDTQLQEILESLQHKEFYNLTSVEKIKVLVTLCHEVLSSDAFDDYMGRLFAEAKELRKEKMAKLKEKKDQEKEEKERLRKEKEELQKQKEEEESKKQLKMDDLNKKEEAESSPLNSNVTVSAAADDHGKVGGQKETKELMKNMSSKKEDKEVSEVVKALKKRREDMANKQEKKLKEEKERLEKEEEENWNINMAHCQYTKRLKPIGYDRNHARYWVFNEIAGGIYVEQGWRNLEDLSQALSEAPEEAVADKEVAMETDGSQKAPVGDDLQIVGETQSESKVEAPKKDVVQELRVSDVSYSWSCYDTAEEVQALLQCLSYQGIRESALRKAIKEQMESIIEGIRRNAMKRPTKPVTDEEEVFNSIKEELKDTAERLSHGNLAILGDGLEEYQQAVDQASSVSDVGSQLEKLLPAVLPQFYQGMFSKDKPRSEQAKQSWLEEVKKATTVSRLHLLLGILDSTVIWDLSAENARCKICHLKGIGRTLILCDDCNLGFHLQCLRPALSDVPEGHWSCPICKPNERLSSRTSIKIYREDDSSEGEDEASEASLEDSEDSSGDETDGHEDYCHVCGEDGDLICCDTCPLVYHRACHQPPLRNIPRGAWSCWQCRQPKNKKQRKNLQGNHKTKSKAAKTKTGKRGSPDESSFTKSKSKRSRSFGSEESGYEMVSKRTRQRRQPMEISDDVSPRGRKRRARASIEELSDDDTIVRKTKASKSRRRSGDQVVVTNSSVLGRLRRRYAHNSDNEEESSDSNVKSFYGRSTRRPRQRKVSSDANKSNEGHVNEGTTQGNKTVGNRGLTSRRKRSRIAGDSEDEDIESDEKENLPTSQNKNGSPKMSARRSTRNKRRVSSSSEDSNGDDKDVSQSTDQRASRSKRNRGSKPALSSFDESDESGLNTSKSNALKRRALKNRCPEPKKSCKGSEEGQKRRRDKNEKEEDAESDGAKEAAKQGKQRKGGIKNSSSVTERRTQTSDTKRAKVPEQNNKEKRRRASVDMDTCEKILRDVILHEDSWPFTQAVNVREVPDYLELVKAPMDLGTIRDKLNSLVYTDVESFVADVRLVFDNSNKYNLDNSEVGKAGKNLEKYFNNLVKQNFSNPGNKSKIQRKR